MGETVDVGSSALTSIVVASNGMVYTSGVNSTGQLGDGTTEVKKNPVIVRSPDGTGKLENIIKAKQGGAMFAIRGDGTLWAWGYTETVDEVTTNITLPVQVRDSSGEYITNVADFDTGSAKVIKGDGSVWEWNNGIMTAAEPTEETTVADALQVEGNLMLKYDGTVWARGSNEYGQLGIGQNTSYTTEDWVQVKGYNGNGYLTNIVQISSKLTNTALAADGTVYTWGNNQYGTCGNRSTSDQNVPTKVKGVGGSGYISGVVKIVGFQTHTYAFMSDGELVAWGSNLDGQMGSGGANKQYNYPDEVFKNGEYKLDDFLNAYTLDAYEVPENRWVYARRERNGDTDFFTFVHNGDGEVFLEVEWIGHPTGNTVGHMFQYDAELEDFDQLTATTYRHFPVEAGKRYYIMVYCAGYNTFYRFRLSTEINVETDTNIDDYGDGISDAYALPVVNERPQHMTPGAIDYEGDTDTFKFTPTTSGTHYIYTTSENSLQGVLSDSDGEMIISSPAGETANGFRLEWDLLAGEDYYITVSSEETTELPEYQLYVEHAGFDIYSYDVEILGYKNRITNFCKELFNDGNQHMSQEVYNEYELAFDADLAVHELPESIESISDGLAYEAAVREYFFTKQEELEEVKQGYLDIIEEYIEAEPINMTANAELLSPDAVMNVDATEEENEVSTIIRRPSGGAGAPLIPGNMVTESLILQDGYEVMTTTDVNDTSVPSFSFGEPGTNSVLCYVNFPTNQSYSSHGYMVSVIDFNQGETETTMPYNGRTYSRTTSTVNITNLQPGGMYVVGLHWSTDGGEYYGGENSHYRWIKIPETTNDEEQQLSTYTFKDSKNVDKIKVTLENQDKALTTSSLFNQWGENLAKVYESLKSFTGYTPYEGEPIELKSTRSTAMNDWRPVGLDFWELTIAYAGNPAMFSRPFYRSLMMRLEDGDWGDAAIHELSHDFDIDDWSFDMEVMADLKLAYVLDTVSNSKIYRFDTDEYYNYSNIYNFFKTDQYHSYDNTFAKGEYHHRGMTSIMLGIAQTITWTPFQLAFQEYTDEDGLTTEELNYLYGRANDERRKDWGEEIVKFNLFMMKLNKHSTVDVFSLISDADKQIIEAAYGGCIESTLPPSESVAMNSGPINISIPSGYAVRKFIPSESGKYDIYTTRYGGTGEIQDTVLEIYADDYFGILLYENDNASNSKFSKITAELEKNQTYYIRCRNKTNGRLHTDLRVKKETEDIQGAKSIIVPEMGLYMFRYKPLETGAYEIALNIHEDRAPVIADAIIEVYTDETMSKLIARSTYEQAQFPSIDNIQLTENQYYYIIVKGYVGRSVKAELSIMKSAYVATVEYYFDKGYSEKYGGDAAARAEIMKYHNKVVEKFEELCNLVITLDSNSQPTRFESSVEKCKLASHTTNGDCSCSSADSYLASAGAFGGSNTRTVGLWSGYTIKKGEFYHRSFSNNEKKIIVLLEQNREDIEDYVLGVLIHELGHQYGAIDHYHEGGVPIPREETPTKCENTPQCHYCGTSPYKRPEKCIMSEADNYNDCTSTNGNSLFCTACKNEIIVHLNNHH